MSKTKNYRELVNEAINISKQADASYSHERLLELLKQSKTLTIQALDSGWPEEDGRELSIECIIKNIINGYLPLSVVINLAKSGSEAADDILIRLLDVKETSIESLEAIDKYLEESREENTTTETNSGGSSPNSSPTSSPTKKPADDHVVPDDSNCNCVVSYCTDIIYDNPVLNQINKNGLFSALNWNKNFDSYNFDPQALIRAERETIGHLPQVDDVSQINFDSVLPNSGFVKPDTLLDQAYTMWNDLGLSTAGVISLLALSFVAESI